jgi:hypothetical protein
VQGEKGSVKRDMAVDECDLECCVDFKAGLVIVDLRFRGIRPTGDTRAVTHTLRTCIGCEAARWEHVKSCGRRDGDAVRVWSGSG